MRPALFITVFLSACASSTPAPESKEPAPREAPAALEACLAALGESHAHPMGRALSATEACGPIWSREACADSWTSSLSLYPGERAGHIFAACAEAYCDDMQAPRPELCSRDASRADLIDEEVDWLQMWTSFNRRALGDTLGEENAIEAAQFSRTLMLLVSMTKGRHDGSQGPTESGRP